MRRILLGVIIIAGAALLGNQICAGETIRVGVESFPPMIISANEGYTIDMLRSIEQMSDLTFDIKAMSYSRAKGLLKAGRLDLIAHTPHQLETPDFYEYAQEINWSKDTVADFYAVEKSKLENYKDLKIGVPLGNKEFISELSGISLEQFQEATLESLIQMLEKGRIDLFWFERASTMITMKKLHLNNVYYMKFPEQAIPVGIAVRKNQQGDQLKARLEALLLEVDQTRIFAHFDQYLNMPSTGVFSSEE